MSKLKLLGVGVVLSVILFFTLVNLTIVETGYVGVKVSLYGKNQGVQDLTLRSGYVFHSRFTERVMEFPTFMQNVVWTQALDEGSPTNEEIVFNSIEGAKIGTDVAVSYQFVEEKIPSIFLELRQDAEYIKRNYMRSKVRDAFNRVASQMKVVSIFGEGKTELLTKVRQELERELGPKGFVFDMIGMIGDLRVDPKVQETINATISASQKAIEAENKVRQSKAEADQKIEEARGEAESISLVAKAKAEANRVLTESLSPELLNYEALQRWDGVLPRVTGGNTIPMINIDSVNTTKQN